MLRLDTLLLASQKVRAKILDLRSHMLIDLQPSSILQGTQEIPPAASLCRFPEGLWCDQQVLG